MKTLKSTNPAKNYEIVGEVKVSTTKEVKQAVEASQAAKGVWGELGVGERVKRLKPLISRLLEHKEEIARLITNEMGKPISEAREEVDDTVKDIEYFIAKGPVYLADEVFQENKERRDLVRHEPWGVTAVIVPWNWPLQMPEWGIIPNLISGNTVVFKPSEESPLAGQKFADLFFELDLPQGVFNIIQGGREVGQQLVDSDIDLVWFTGSAKAGQEIFAQAGKKFIKAVMELGGSSPTIVFNDVEVNDQLINYIYLSRFVNCGQACSALKRLFIQEEIFDELVKKLVTKIKTVKIGDPLLEDMEMGSLVAKRQLDLVKEQVEEAVKQGAKIECGGQQPQDLVGAYYLPTVLTNLKPEMRVLCEEVFAPVLPIMAFKTEAEVITLANDTKYGLTAEVYTQDEERAWRVAEKIETGRVSINAPRWSGPNCPFGGYKKSGMGREHGRWGFEELTQLKHIKIKK